MDTNISLYGSICLSDIPKALVTTGKNGKKYLNISVRARKERSRYGHTHYVKVDTPKGVQIGDPNLLYIGGMKPSTWKAVEEDNKRASTPTSTKDYPWE